MLIMISKEFYSIKTAHVKSNVGFDQQVGIIIVNVIIIFITIILSFFLFYYYIVCFRRKAE